MYRERELTVTAIGELLPARAGRLGSLVLVDGAILLRPEAVMFEAILDGWRLQQESRLLAAPTVESRDKTLRRFQSFTGDYAWRFPRPGPNGSQL